MIRKIVNFALFDVCWTACVLAGARDLPAVALAAAGAVVGVNLWWFSKDRASDVRLLLMVTLIGFVMDTANLRLGVFSRRFRVCGGILCGRGRDVSAARAERSATVRA